MKKFILFIILIIFVFVPALQSEEGRLLRYPNSSKTDIVFVYSGDLYVVPLGGGLARKVTNGPDEELFPRISPDGMTIAFSAMYDGNREIYTMPLNGGTAKRLTYSMDIGYLPERMGPDKIILQWTADGKQILYNSREISWHAWVRQLFLLDKDGGLPQQIEVPRTGFASLSPDGKKIAYNRIFREFRTWKRYRGGQADDIWIYDLKTKVLENITNNPAQDIIPIWHGNKIYYISDRDAVMNLFVYDLTSKQTKKITNFTEFDVKWPSKGADHIAFENGGYIYLMDYATETVKKVEVQLAGDFPNVRPTYMNVESDITEFGISPDGARGLFVARGDLFTVPAEKGNIRHLTGTTGVHERSAVWSPDGKWIAFISDESGETEVHLISNDGKTKKQLTKNATTYRYNAKWSPDSKKLICSDKEMKLYYIDIESGKTTQVAHSKHWEYNEYNWSPDSKWIVYTDYSDNAMSVVNLYSLESGKTTQLTDNFFNSGSATFSQDGKYIYFVSDRSFNASIGTFEWNYQFSDMSKIYGLTLQKDLKSPFGFESDEVKVQSEEASTSKDKKTDNGGDATLSIDLDNIQSRLFVLPLSAGNYYNLKSIDDKLYYVKNVKGKKPALYKFDMTKKDENKVADFSSYEFSADGKKIIFKSGDSYYITGVSDDIKPSAGKLALNDMQVLVDRKVEWKQIFEESWRQMRDFFYDPNMHGVDWQGVKKKYAQLVPYVNSRKDLTYVIGEMIGELNVGHAYVGGGEEEEINEVPIGYLGAEMKLHSSGAFQITKIFQGRNWEEKTRSPLTEPGINVKEGDYILEIDGQKLAKDYTPWMALVNKSEKYVTLKVNSKPSADGAKEYTVKTLANEKNLRYFNWVESNRRKVEEASGGKLAYVHVPDMGVGNGLVEFVKYFYPQVRKEGLIIDDRYNGGGNVSPMIIERLRRELLLVGIARNQQSVTTKPDAVMTGPIVCLINELSASDGDLFPYQFKQAGIGKIIGKRSWGGVIGIRGSLPFIDGGYMMKPEFANFGADGTWVLEGEGMIPDIEIDNHPSKEWMGVDEQLNEAIRVALEEIKTNTKTKIPKVPPYPDKSK